MKFPKLHSWLYDIVDTIREYGAINRYTTETYESLHKTYVKNPYRLSNRKDVEKQIMQTVNIRNILKCYEILSSFANYYNIFRFVVEQ